MQISADLFQNKKSVSIASFYSSLSENIKTLWDFLGKMCSIIVLIIMGMLGESVASVHKVGGSAGWTILGKVDYNKWTSSDTFTVGDSLCNVIHTSTFLFSFYI